MPRTKASPKKCVKSQVANDTLLLILKGDALTIPEGCDGKLNIVKLRHPQTSSQAMFFFSADNKMVQEILSFSEDKRSWVIDDHIQSDGKVHLSTPVDPLFLILPYMTKSAGRFESLEQLIQDEDFPETKRLLQCVTPKQLRCISEIKEVGDDKYYRINEEKTLRWLTKKVKRVSEVLKEKGIHVGPGAVSANFVRGSRYVDADTAPAETEFLLYAFGILSEYISADLCMKLRNALDLPEATSNDSGKGKKRKADECDAGDGKKTKVEEAKDNAPSSTFVPKSSEPKAAPKKETAKDKALARAAVGTKSISNFFKRK
ncbi:ribonuclease H2 subunit B [Neocloeon triangulifer]|uniref:ribonuclease H2 subunit B n=1 Tax=Neocloeon triangulifer TaxID=2078957 RepID=UPI00286F0A06|nr:ribonuclease H2 subunit B [Neocloeon triangulifer]